MLVLKYLREGNILASPVEPENYTPIFQLRWEVLRKPWAQPPGSEQDDLEYQAIHRVITTPGKDSPVLACGRIHQADALSAQIRYMAVGENHQGKGFGAEILKSLEQAGSELNIRQIFLHAREPALGFYLKAGYQTEAEAEPFLGIRHFRMVKSLIHHF